MEIGDLLVQRWNDETKSRLDQDLQDIIRNISKGTNHILSNTQFYMVGKRYEENLLVEPTIVISCDTKECQKKVTKHLVRFKLHYLDDFGCPTKVRYQRAPCFWASVDSCDAPLSGGRSSQTGIHQTSVQEYDSRTACGLRLSSDFDIHGFPQQQKYATFGGVIWTEGHCYEMTTAHTFLDEMRSKAEANNEDDGDGHHSSSHDSGFDSDTESSDSLGMSESLLFDDCMDFQPLSRSPSTVVAVYSFGIARHVAEKTNFSASCTANHDWALLENPPSLALPNLNASNQISAILPEGEFSSGPVYILSGADILCKGFVTQTKATVHTHHSVMDVREVLLDKALVAAAASGSWVVQSNRLCGYIVAVTNQRLSCFMIAAEPAFKDVETVLGSGIGLTQLHQLNTLTQISQHSILPNPKSNEDKGIGGKGLDSPNCQGPRLSDDSVQWTGPEPCHKSYPSHKLPSAEPENHPEYINLLDASSFAEEGAKLSYNNYAEPYSPELWTRKKRILNLSWIVVLTTFSFSGSTIIAPAIPDIPKTYSITNKALGGLLVSIYVLGFVMGPLLATPVSEFYGRLTVCKVCEALLILWNILSAVGPNINGLLAFRFLSGAAAVGSIAIMDSSIEDLMGSSEKRKLSYILCAIGPIAGPPTGSIIGGWVAQAAGWRWVFGVSAILVSGSYE